MENLIRKAVLVGFPRKDTIEPKILRTDIGTEMSSIRGAQGRAVAVPGSARRGRTRRTCRHDRASRDL